MRARRQFQGTVSFGFPWPSGAVGDVPQAESVPTSSRARNRRAMVWRDIEHLLGGGVGGIDTHARQQVLTRQVTFSLRHVT